MSRGILFTNYKAGWPPISEEEYNNPESDYWEEMADGAWKNYNKLPVEEEEYNRVVDGINMATATWRDLDTYYREAYNEFQDRYNKDTDSIKMTAEEQCQTTRS